MAVRPVGAAGVGVAVGVGVGVGVAVGVGVGVGVGALAESLVIFAVDGTPFPFETNTM